MSSNHHQTRILDRDERVRYIGPVHPLDLLDPPLVPEVLDPQVVEDTPQPLPQKTSSTNGNGHGEEGTTSALAYARKMSPKVTRRLVELSLTSPNHAAARSACRDVLQVAGLLAETTRVDVIVSFKAIFQRMTAEELDKFLTIKEFPDRLRDEALKLLEHAA